MTKENKWFLEKMIEISENAFAEGKTFSHEEVKEMLKLRRNENRLVAASV